MGTITKEGEVRTFDKITLFKVDRSMIDPTHRFLRFTFKDMKLEGEEEEDLKVELQGVELLETCRNHNGPVDSLSRLLYRCSLRQGRISITDIDKAVPK